MLLITDHACLASNNIVSKLHPPARVQSEPLVAPEYEWEAGGVYCQGSLLREGNTYRLWYSAIGTKRREQQYLAYAEAGADLQFQKILKPEWGLDQWPQTNVLYGQNFNVAVPNVHHYYEPREGYKYFLVFDSRLVQHQNQYVPRHPPYSRPGDRDRWKRHRNYTPDFDWAKYFAAGDERAIYIADSRDGFLWEPPDARVAIPGQSDGDHTVVYDPRAHLYRMYFRDNRLDENGERVRQVMTATSRDTIEWSEPRLCLESDALDDPRVHQIHGLTVTYHDGVFVGLLQILEVEEEVELWNPLLPMERGRFHVQLTVSYDGENFHRVADRGEYFGTIAAGGWDSGMVRSGGQWVFEDERMLMPYDGRNCKHTPAPGEEYLCGIGLAQSPLDRFAGLTPRDKTRPGYLLIDLPEGASTLRLNCEFGKGGRVAASLYHPDGSRLYDWSEEQSTSIQESGLRMPLAWQNKKTWPQGKLHLRLRLDGDATIYALYFKEGSIKIFLP